MILVTAGMLNSVGPFRMYVDIARQLAFEQIPSFRFDLSGIGESLGVGATGRSIDRAADEVVAAMDHLSSEHQIEHFILFGLCSGADDSFQTALIDKRVKGLIALDGVGYETNTFKRTAKRAKLKLFLNWKKWLYKFKSILRSEPPATSLAAGGDVREFPDSADLARPQFQQLIDQGTHLHFIYTGGSGYYNYQTQFYDMLPGVQWNNTESTQYFPHMDHVVLLCEDRQELATHVVEKMKAFVQALTSCK